MLASAKAAISNDELAQRYIQAEDIARLVGCCGHDEGPSAIDLAGCGGKWRLRRCACLHVVCVCPERCHEYWRTLVGGSMLPQNQIQDHAQKSVPRRVARARMLLCIISPPACTHVCVMLNVKLCGGRRAAHTARPWPSLPWWLNGHRHAGLLTLSVRTPTWSASMTKRLLES